VEPGVGIEPGQQRRVLRQPQWSFTFFEASRLRHRIALQVRFEMLAATYFGPRRIVLKQVPG
jgi:hypothetical protein